VLTSGIAACRVKSNMFYDGYLVHQPLFILALCHHSPILARYCPVGVELGILNVYCVRLSEGNLMVFPPSVTAGN
jgi:hypothetical protein